MHWWEKCEACSLPAKDVKPSGWVPQPQAPQRSESFVDPSLQSESFVDPSLKRETKPANHRAYGIALLVAFVCMVLAAMGAQQNHQPQSPIFVLIFWVIVGRWIWVTVKARNAKA